MRLNESSSYDLCFLDGLLPDVSGEELLEQFKELSPTTKVIMMFAGIMTSSMQEYKYIEKYAYMYITKLLDLQQVKMLVKNALD
jgi:DNA-binding NtrC family response regulator